MVSTKSSIEICLSLSQCQVIINAWRMLDFQSFFMIMTSIEPFISNYESIDELNFLVSVMYQKTHSN